MKVNDRAALAQAKVRADQLLKRTEALKEALASDDEVDVGQVEQITGSIIEMCHHIDTDVWLATLVKTPIPTEDPESPT